MYRKPEVVVASASIEVIQNSTNVMTKGILTQVDGNYPHPDNQTTAAYEGDE
jgi:hypothetical protein